MHEKPFDVFISHSSLDKAVASVIKQHLQAEGLRCWKAPDDIQPGESWPQAIMRGISNSRLMLLVWSANSVSSSEVNKELTHAMRSGMTVVPLRIEDVKPALDWEYHLVNTHWMDAFDGGLEIHLSTLSQYLCGILKIVPPTPEPEPISDPLPLKQSDSLKELSDFTQEEESASDTAVSANLEDPEASLVLDACESDATASDPKPSTDHLVAVRPLLSIASFLGTHIDTCLNQTVFSPIKAEITLLGTYIGKCISQTVNPPIKAEITLVLKRLSGNEVIGDLSLRGELDGGSSFSGVYSDGILTFITSSSDGKVKITWKGRYSSEDNTITGDYNVVDDHFLASILGSRNHHGVWKCKLCI